MAFPTYERQNKWISDYILPIFLDLNINKVIQNYKKNNPIPKKEKYFENSEDRWERLVNLDLKEISF
jgi:hypothetical protein